MQVCASTSLGFVELRWVSKHMFPLVTAPSWMHLDTDPGSWSWLWRSELQDHSAEGCAHIGALLLIDRELGQIAEYLPL